MNYEIIPAINCETREEVKVWLEPYCEAERNARRIEKVRTTEANNFKS